MSTNENSRGPPPIHRGLFNIYLDTTAISDVDGIRGCLSYRGVPIEQLVDHICYLDVFHLLTVGRLPTDAERAIVETYIADGEKLAASLIEFVHEPDWWEPLLRVRTAVSLCGPLRSLRLEASRADDVRPAALRALGVAGAVIRDHAQDVVGHLQGKTRSAGFTAGLLEGLISRAPSVLEYEMIDLAFVALAEHSLAASTLAARVVASTEGDFASALSAAMAAFAGRLHGGAVDEVATMLLEVGAPEHAAAWVRERRRGRRPVPGFGHRVYRTRDPRAVILADAARRLAAGGMGCELLEVLDAIGNEMSDYRQHGVDFNVDAYASVLFLMLGIPKQFFVPLFAVARFAGWCAHIEEQVRNNILIRPRLLYRGKSAGGPP
jgi:citrate synthase